MGWYFFSFISLQIWRCITDSFSSLLDCYWKLKASERIAFRCAILVYKCLHRSAPSYTSSMNFVKWRMLRYFSDYVPPCLYRWSSATLDYLLSATEPLHLPLLVYQSVSQSVRQLVMWHMSVWRKRMASTDAIWNSLPKHVTSALLMGAFRSCLKCQPFLRFFAQHLTVQHTVSAHWQYIILDNLIILVMFHYAILHISVVGWHDGHPRVLLYQFLQVYLA